MGIDSGEDHFVAWFEMNWGVPVEITVPLGRSESLQNLFS